MRGVTTGDIARGYLAVVVNSNYSREIGMLNAESSKPELLSNYLSYGEVAQVVNGKIRDTFRRRLRKQT
jgi:hypothetical protein